MTLTKVTKAENLICRRKRGGVLAKQKEGHDALPIKFYNVFWPLIAQILVECFNEAYERKEMTNLQRNSIITLMQNG